MGNSRFILRHRVFGFLAKPRPSFPSWEFGVSWPTQPGRLGLLFRQCSPLAKIAFPHPIFLKKCEIKNFAKISLLRNFAVGRLRRPPHPGPGRPLRARARRRSRGPPSYRAAGNFRLRRKLGRARARGASRLRAAGRLPKIASAEAILPEIFLRG